MTIALVSRHPLADVVPGWDKMNCGERAQMVKGLKKCAQKLEALPSTDPRFLKYRRQVDQVEAAALAAGLTPPMCDSPSPCAVRCRYCPSPRVHALAKRGLVS